MKSSENTPAKAHSTSVKSKGGRPGHDVDDLMVRIMYEAPKALSDAELCKFLAIGESTFYDIKSKNPEFQEVLKEYKRISPLHVLSALRKVCVGFEYDETVRELERDKKTGKKRLVVKKVTRKFVTPNAAAIQFYLKNTMPERFKDKIEAEHSFSGLMENITFVIKGKS